MVPLDAQENVAGFGNTIETEMESETEKSVWLSRVEGQYLEIEELPERNCEDEVHSMTGA